VDEKQLQQIKQHHIWVNVVSFLVVIALTIVLTASLTLAAFGDNIQNGNSMPFGNIALDDVTQNFTVIDGAGLTPGDSTTVNFNIENKGTADMLVRFRAYLQDKNTLEPLDPSVFNISISSVSNANGAGAPEYVLFNFTTQQIVAGGVANSQADVWFVRRQPLIGNLDTVTLGPNDPPDVFTLNVTFPHDDTNNNYKNAQFDLILRVESVQYANNGDQRDITLPNYDVSWSS
jgi:hypothetical protein